MIRIPRPPKSAPPPPTLLRTPIAALSSPKAPPIARRPFAISSKDILLNSIRESERISTALARARIATEVLSVRFLSPIKRIDAPSSTMTPPTERSPLTISSKSSPDISTMASERISTALAIAIIATAAFKVPFVSNFLTVCDNAAKLALSSSIKTSIAPRENPIEMGLIVESLSIALTSNVTAPAIPTKEATFIPSWKD